MSDCSECYETEFPACYGYLNLDMGLTPSTSYVIWIKDKFENNYHIEVTSDAEGSVSIPLEDFPEGLFTSSAEYFSLYVSTSTVENTQEEFTIGYEDYSCVVFNMFRSTEV